MNFKDLQYNIGKLTTNVKSQVARNNPLQSQDTRSLNLWLFEECNDLAFMKKTAYHHGETNKAFLEWIHDDVYKNSDLNYSEDMQDIGEALASILEKQVQLEQEYASQYQLYRRAIKSLREKEQALADLCAKQQSIQDRLVHLQKSNPKSKKISEFEQALAGSDTKEQERQTNAFKRIVLKEAFYLKFNALQAYAEKTAMLAGFGKYIVDLLDDDQHASSNSQMILTDALLSIDGWKPKDQRETITKELEIEEEEPDAVVLENVDPNELELPSTKDTYCHQLHHHISQHKKHPIQQHNRSYVEFQHAFDEKREYYAEIPPAYSDDKHNFPSEKQKDT